MTDAFISYSRKDKTFVQRLFTALEQQGHDAWVDWDDIEYAEDWWRKIQAGIEGADNFVFIISPSSARSKVCFDEVQHADANHKRIVPVVIEDVMDDADQERMHPALKRQNWLFFRPEDDYDAMLTTLLETLRREPEHVQMHTRLLVNAHEWEAHERDDSLAVRGENLRRAERWLAQVEGKSPQPTDLHRAYIAASRKADQGRRQRASVIGGVVLVVIAIIALVAFMLFQQTQSDQQVQASLAQADLASTPFKNGDMFQALSLVVEANEQLANPPDKSLNALREMAGAPGPVALFTSDSPVTSVAFSPDRTRIVAGYADGSLRLWDATQGVGSYDTPLFATAGDMLHVESVDNMDFGPQGRFVVSSGCFARDSASTDEGNTCVRPEINLWEIVNDQLIRRHHFTNPDDDAFVRGEAYDVVFNPKLSDATTLEIEVAPGQARSPAIINYHFDDPTNINDVFIGAENRDNPLPAPVTAVSVSIDGAVVGGNAKGFLTYYNGQSKGITSQSENRVNDVMFTPSTNYSIGGRPFLAGSADGMLQLASRDGIINTWPQGSPVNSVAYSPDGASALAAVEGGWLVLMHDIESGASLSILRWKPNVAFTAAAFGASLETTFAPTSYAVSGSADGNVILWDTSQTDLSSFDTAGLLDWALSHRYLIPVPEN